MMKLLFTLQCFYLLIALLLYSHCNVLVFPLLFNKKRKVLYPWRNGKENPCVTGTLLDWLQGIMSMMQGCGCYSPKMYRYYILSIRN